MKQVTKNMQALVLMAAIIALLGFSSCGTASTASALTREVPDSNELEVNNSTKGFDDLTLYLKQIAGVNVRGSGGDATIMVRGVNSMTAEARPLYVVNGNPIGNNYSEIYDMINVDQVKNIRVLKSSVDTSIYGMRGSNGVIEIDMK